MTFKSHHYVPVLKIKRGEKFALKNIAAPLRARITPLLEFVELKEGKTTSAHLDTAFKDLSSSVGGYARCFLDARELDPLGAKTAAEVFERAGAAGIAFTPVTGLSRKQDLTAALRERKRGLALRLLRTEFESGGLRKKIDKFLLTHKLAKGDCDLIVDLGPVEDLIVEGIGALTAAFLNEVPDHVEWGTLTVSACAFPKSMGIVSSNSHREVERAEWRAWRDRLQARRATLKRLPSFSDCAIQHPIGVEGFDPRVMQVSASVRYTAKETWLLVKGQSTRAVPASDQFPRLARKLVSGQLKSNFAGSTHCLGCAGMKEAALGASGYGSAEKWRRLGTIHHISTVIEQMARLPWP
jgi:hypothetical protein